MPVIASIISRQTLFQKNEDCGANYLTVHGLHHKLNIKEHTVATCLGAMVSVEWAKPYPHELLGCVLINTILRPFNPFYRRLRPRNYLRLLRMAALENDAGEIEFVILRMTSHRSGQLASVVKTRVTYCKERPLTGSNTMREIIARYGIAHHQIPRM